MRLDCGACSAQRDADVAGAPPGAHFDIACKQAWMRTTEDLTVRLSASWLVRKRMRAFVPAQVDLATSTHLRFAVGAPGSLVITNRVQSNRNTSDDIDKVCAADDCGLQSWRQSAERQTSIGVLSSTRIHAHPEVCSYRFR